MIRVLFVCSGNICRSPMADAVFADMVAEAGLADQIQVDSAGTGAWHTGERAHQGTLRILREHNIPYNGRARQMEPTDLKHFDYVLAMDESHLRHINRCQQHKATVRLFMHEANTAGLSSTTEVPDPYYTGKFELVYDLVETGSRALLDAIRKQHNL